MNNPTMKTIRPIQLPICTVGTMALRSWSGA